MGEYFNIVNLDKKEKLVPHCFGDGLKLGEFGSSGFGTMFGLSKLLNTGNRWAGDRIIIAGDYSNESVYSDPDIVNISHEVVAELDKDPQIKYIREDRSYGFKCSCGKTDQEWIDSLVKSNKEMTKTVRSLEGN